MSFCYFNNEGSQFLRKSFSNLVNSYIVLNTSPLWGRYRFDSNFFSVIRFIGRATKCFQYSFHNSEIAVTCCNAVDYLVDIGAECSAGSPNFPISDLSV